MPERFAREAARAARLPQLRAAEVSQRAGRSISRRRTTRRWRLRAAPRADGGRRPARALRGAAAPARTCCSKARRGAARRRPRHLSVRHLEQLRRGCRGGGRGRGPADAALRPRHHQGVYDARRLRAVSDRARGRRPASGCARAATNSARPPAGRAAAAGSTPRCSSARSRSTASPGCASPSSTCSTAWTS